MTSSRFSYSRPRRAAAAVVAAALLAACGTDLTVTNPGPLQDAELNTPSAVPALVNGMSGDLSYALGNYIDRGALASGELTEAGNFSAEQHYYEGVISPDDVNPDWANMQTARWSAEHGLERMRAVLGDAFEGNTNTPRAYLYAGFANRLLGENVCVGVIDGGAPQSDSVYFQRADSLFTRALTLAQAQKNTTVQNAALGGRASVRADLGNWSGAAADAALVPTSFVFNAIFSTNTPRENNDLANQTITRRETTVWGTTFAATKSDPRTPWDTVKTTSGKVQTGQDGKTPFFRQGKYTSLGANVPLTKGTEMLLIRAEAALRAGDVAGAMTLINQERAQYKLAPVAAATAGDAETILQSERGSVLWLEGRRLWDLRRWLADGTDTFLKGRSTCVPASRNEIASNPNM
ncbi:MAG TPA: RagB/SusD family nutrient uptake outer membrane protein [Gemmatimonadaceae bacterium]|nr:RagB/SusD family nutrient uptake outer membrane protein [Gemmatimonadaceae bacterium]